MTGSRFSLLQGGRAVSRNSAGRRGFFSLLSQSQFFSSVRQALFSLLFSAYNLRRFRSRKPAAPIAINLVVDVVVAFFAITYGAGGLSGLLDGQGGWCSYPGGDYAICRRGALPVKVFAGIAMGAGIVVG